MRGRKAKYAKVPISECVVHHTLVGHGIHQFTCFWGGFQAPVGTVWAHIFNSRRGTTAFILDSFVPEWCRRNGIRSLINREILKQATTIASSDASQPDGMAFMRASGYRHARDLGMMVLTRKR